MSTTTTKKTNGINGNVEAPYTSTSTRDALLKEHGDTSKAIRALLAQGLKQSEVAKRLNIRPQHVNNVKNQVLKPRS